MTNETTDKFALVRDAATKAMSIGARSEEAWKELTKPMAKSVADRLREPFSDDEIEWRPLRVGKTQNDARAWALLAPFVQARAIMNRLDEVFGIGGWQDEYREIQTPNGAGCVCRLTVKIDGEWVTKTDGADFTDIENTKGGISDALKRAAVKYGIGRYLYDLDNHFANVQDTQPAKGIRSIKIDDKKLGVKGWVVCPSLNKAEPTVPENPDTPDRPVDGGRAMLVQYIAANEGRVYPNVHAKLGARRKYAGADQINEMKDVEAMRKYADHIREEISKKEAKVA